MHLRAKVRVGEPCARPTQWKIGVSLNMSRGHRKLFLGGPLAGGSGPISVPSPSGHLGQERRGGGGLIALPLGLLNVSAAANPQASVEGGGIQEIRALSAYNPVGHHATSHAEQMTGSFARSVAV